MNIYDLDKLATPGPLHIESEFDEVGKPNRISLWRNEQGGASRVLNIEALQSDYDIRMLAHCRNHFMRALSALKADERELAMAYGEKNQRSVDLRELIAELEDVHT